jgi:hypothetical protein
MVSVRLWNAASLVIEPFLAPYLEMLPCCRVEKRGQARTNDTSGYGHGTTRNLEPTSGIEPETSSLPWMRSAS